MSEELARKLRWIVAENDFPTLKELLADHSKVRELIEYGEQDSAYLLSYRSAPFDSALLQASHSGNRGFVKALLDNKEIFQSIIRRHKRVYESGKEVFTLQHVLSAAQENNDSRTVIDILNNKAAVTAIIEYTAVDYLGQLLLKATKANQRGVTKAIGSNPAILDHILDKTPEKYARAFQEAMDNGGKMRELFISTVKPMNPPRRSREKTAAQSKDISAIVDELWAQGRYEELKAFFKSDEYKKAVDHAINEPLSLESSNDCGRIIGAKLVDSLTRGDTKSMLPLLQSEQNRRLIAAGQLDGYIQTGLEETANKLAALGISTEPSTRLVISLDEPNDAVKEIDTRLTVLFSVPEVRMRLHERDYLRSIPRSNNFFHTAFQQAIDVANFGVVRDIEHIADTAIALEQKRAATERA